MRILNEDQIYSYSAAMTAPCGKGIMVWRDKKHSQQDQMRDHLKECKECQEIIYKYESLEDAGFLSGYVDQYMKKEVIEKYYVRSSFEEIEQKSKGTRFEGNKVYSFLEENTAALFVWRKFAVELGLKNAWVKK